MSETEVRTVGDDTRSSEPQRRGRKRRDQHERDRLATQIGLLEASLRSEPHAKWAATAGRLATLARTALEDGRLDAGWTSLMAARRATYDGLDDDARAHEAERIRTEANAKLQGWRKDAVAKIASADSAKVTASDLQNAQEIMDEHFGNVHRKLRLFAHQLLLVNALLAAALLVVFGIAFFELPDESAPIVLRDWRPLVAVMGMGVLGAVVSVASGMFRRTSTARVPETRAEYGLVVVRPLTGAASAVLVVAILRSGLGQAIEVTDAGMYALAAVAGFSERLAARAVDRAVEQITA